MNQMTPDGRFAAALQALRWNDEQRYFEVPVFRELKSKPKLKKVAGMLSTPCESNEPEDSDVRDVFQRLLLEEFGLSPNQVTYISRSEPINGFSHGWPVYVGVTLLKERIRFEPNDTDDVAFEGWIPLHVFMQFARTEGWTRIETADIVDTALDIFLERGHELLGGR